jgi:hypothetical protein
MRLATLRDPKPVRSVSSKSAKQTGRRKRKSGLPDFPLNRSQHNPPNQPTEWAHEEPINAKLPTARVITTHDSCLSSQDRATGSLLFETEIPDSSSQADEHGTIKICAIEWGEVSRRPPELSVDPEHDFLRLVCENTEAGIGQGLQSDRSFSRRHTTPPPDELWQGSQSHQQPDD